MGNYKTKVPLEIEAYRYRYPCPAPLADFLGDCYVTEIKARHITAVGRMEIYIHRDDDETVYAVEGDWVYQLGDNYMVLSDREFQQRFEPV